VAPVRPEAKEALEKVLEEDAVIPFGKLPSVHFARILIQPDSYGPPPDDKPTPESKPLIPAKLLFATDFDGTVKDHLLELIDVASDGLDKLFWHCEGWPGLIHRDRLSRYEVLAKFVGRHSVVANTFYTGTMNRSVGQILREAELREAVDAHLDQHVGTPGFPVDATGIRDQVRAWIFRDAQFEWVHQRPGRFPSSPPPLIRDHMIGWGIGAILAIAVTVAVILWASTPMTFWEALTVVARPILIIVAIVVAAWVYLSILAATDKVIIRRDTTHAQRLTDREDRLVQNQITTINYIKRPLWFRRLVLRSVLAVINLGARFVSTQGTLSGIPTIHFARWVVVDEGRRLLFFSNYDGSWESYLGDFVDKAHKGLTAIWSNSVGFPRTRGLFNGGAEDEQRFKALARDSQITTDVWYSAYPSLTVSNINDNTRLRLGLYGDLDEAAAQLWLRMAVPRQRLNQVAAPAAGETKLERHDVQGLVARSYKELTTAVYVPVTFPADQRRARAWLEGLIRLVTPADVTGTAAEAIGQVINVAFTRGGLKVLGLHDTNVVGFSREFDEGMATDHRKRLLGDTAEADPEHWKWGGPNNARLDAMLFIFTTDQTRLKEILKSEDERAGPLGVTLGAPLDTSWIGEKGTKEHFGFHDGIAQPLIAGFGADQVAKNGRGPEIPAGEVILGFPNAYARVPLSPTVPDDAVSARFLQPIKEDPARRDFGRNGSYIVFRQLKQDVKAFWEDVDQRAQRDPARRKLLAAKMVGRWPNGAPLVRYPGCEPTKQPDQLNNFWYRNDLDGDRCPIGAHIRRTNPRDGLRPDTEESLKVANRHRLLRRGRAYGVPVADSFDPDDILNAPHEKDPHRGLHFICFNTDIARQFEFVQSTWANSVKFDGLYRDPDPLIAPNGATSPEDKGIFTVQHSPVRQRHQELKRFVTPVGGAYLFMPGINALKYLVVAPASGGSGSR
jgi:Dyp-type peroxidase family